MHYTGGSDWVCNVCLFSTRSCQDCLRDADLPTFRQPIKLPHMCRHFQAVRRSPDRRTAIDVKGELEFLDNLENLRAQIKA